MGLLDQVIGGVLGQMMGGGRGGQGGGMSGGGMGGGGMGGGLGGGAMSPIVQALLMLLMSKGASGGFGDIFGGGREQGPGGDPRHGGGPDPYGHGEDDIGGFGQDRGAGGYGGREERGGEFGDLAGMLDGPGGGGSGGRDGGAGPYARLDRDQADEQGGLDGLIDRFQRGGFGDVMDSWIGPGQNRRIEPNQLAEALGPDTVDSLQSRTGLDRGDLLSQLAQALPGVIDGLTPQGRRPSMEDRQGW
jgi:uncharacterized protein YidB (DUF937 family)